MPIESNIPLLNQRQFSEVFDRRFFAKKINVFLQK